MRSDSVANTPRLTFSGAYADNSNVGAADDPDEHPSGFDLHNFFSKAWGESLSDEERDRIAIHVRLCADCTSIGKSIEEDDSVLETFLSSPYTAEDEDNANRSINVFRVRLRQRRRDEASAAVGDTTSEPDLWRRDSGLAIDLAELIPSLAEAVRNREISKAFAMVDDCIGQLETIPLLQPGATYLLAYCAWVLDYRVRYYDQVKAAVTRFRQIPKKELSLVDLALLNLAEGLLKYHREEYRESEELFRQAQTDADRAEDAELMTVVRYYRGRSLWKLRSYDRALEFIRDAISRDLAGRHHVRVAAMEMVEGWLLFVKGETNLAQAALARARTRFGNQPDAWLDLGNVLSFQGRLYREAGPDHYLRALDCYCEAIQIYEEHDPSHRNVARTHLNAAFIYRLLARDLASKRLPAEMRTEAVAEVAALQNEAFSEVRLARAIYEIARNRHSSGLSGVHSLLAMLHFDRCEFDEAEKSLRAAFAYAAETGDKIGMANARIIQSELVLDCGDAENALRLAKEAVAYAEQTEHRRAIARAYIRQGEALLEMPEIDLNSVTSCLREARERLVAADRDYLRTALITLEERIKEANSSKRKNRSVVYHLTIDALEQEVGCGASLGDILDIVEENVVRFVCMEMYGGNISKASENLKTGTRKIRRALAVLVITKQTIEKLTERGVSEDIILKLASLTGRRIEGYATFAQLVKKTLDSDWTPQLAEMILADLERSA